MDGCKRKAKIINGNPLISGVRFLFESERENASECETLFLSFPLSPVFVTNCDVLLAIQTFLQICCVNLSNLFPNSF